MTEGARMITALYSLEEALTRIVVELQRLNTRLQPPVPVQVEEEEQRDF